MRLRSDVSSIALVVFAGIPISTPSASAQQQQWASQYVNWKFDGSVKEVWNIDQEVWIPQANSTSYWPTQWGFNGLSYGGYIGLQQASAADQNVRFSIWNATAAEGPQCRKFDGEGIGQTCVLNVKIDPNKFYRLRVWRLDADASGQWWGGWLIETGSRGALVESYIGRIKAPVAAKSIDPGSITNFVENWGPAVVKCGGVPLSIVGFTPPAVNSSGKGSGKYQGSSMYSGSQKAPDNRCSTGNENNGAIISAKPYNFGFANGVMMFLGGTAPQQVLDPRTHPTPPDMPHS